MKTHGILDASDAKRCKLLLDTKKFPKKYTQKSPVPISCWHCKDLIVGVPLGLPTFCHIKGFGKSTSQKSKTSKSKIPQRPQTSKFAIDRQVQLDLRGVFCDFPCVASYARECGGIKLSERLNHIRLMREGLRGVPRNQHLNLAPDWRLLKKFGGPLTYEEFRSLTAANGTNRFGPTKRILVERPPIILNSEEEKVYLEESVKVLTPLRYESVPKARPTGCSMPYQHVDGSSQVKKRFGNKNNKSNNQKCKKERHPRKYQVKRAPDPISSSALSVLGGNSENSKQHLQNRMGGLLKFN